MSNDIRLPNIAGAPGSAPITRDPAQARDNASPTAGPSFNDYLKDSIARPLQTGEQQGFQNSDVLAGGLVQSPLKFSAHATSRLKSRGIEMGAEQMRKLSDAVDKAAAKGLDDTLILTKDAAFIVSVKNRTVVTAMDKGQLDGNVFTNIEGAVVVS